MARIKNTTPKKSKKSFTDVQVGTKIFRVGTKLLRTIRKLQSSWQNCIPRTPFSRLIREILQEYSEHRKDFKIQVTALKALQETAELYLVSLFEDGNMCAAHARRITLKSADLTLALNLRGRFVNCSQH